LKQGGEQKENIARGNGDRECPHVFPGMSSRRETCPGRGTKGEKRGIQKQKTRAINQQGKAKTARLRVYYLRSRRVPGQGSKCVEWRRERKVTAVNYLWRPRVK